MVKITNGLNTYTVTRGAFDGIYSRQGYVLVDKKEETKSIEVNQVLVDDEKFIDEVLEKPISQWNKDEIKRFAAIKSLDISETKNANEARNIIKQFLESEE